MTYYDLVWNKEDQGTGNIGFNFILTDSFPTINNKDSKYVCVYVHVYTYW